MNKNLQLFASVTLKILILSLFKSNIVTNIYGMLARCQLLDQALDIDDNDPQNGNYNFSLSFLIKIFIEVELIYNIVLVSDVHCVCVYVCVCVYIYIIFSYYFALWFITGY